VVQVDDLEKYRAPALDKGLDILELLAATEESLSQAEIAKALDRSPNEIYRMLDRLVRRGFVRRTAADRYEVTLKLFELAHARPPLQRLLSQAMPVMRRFARDAEQACHLATYDRGNLVVAAQVDGPGYWNVSVRVGSRISLINTGSGHVLLAFAAADERRLMLEEQDQPEQLTPALEERLTRVRQQGFENMQSLQIAGVSNLSVPILGPMGRVLAVFTCPYSERLDVKTAPNGDAVMQMLIACGQEISQRRGNGG
jgi:DNA-binding IclR family transcriptional regulator